MSEKKLETATFAAGCFWSVEEKYRLTEGVNDTSVGYSGGSKENPTYEEVCSGTTGHAEVVRVEYDPSVVRYEDLLNIFWEHIDPTTLNRQGPDIGTQYRSAIFVHTPEQREKAAASLEGLKQEGKYEKEIVTEIEEEKPFYPAEEYHQRYIAKRKEAGVIQ